MKQFLLILLIGMAMTVQNAVVEFKPPKPSEWDVFVMALIEVESKGDTFAVGKTNDAGILQITPIYVKDVNRILGEQRYCLEDRFDAEKSIEMFNIMQAHYNKEQDINMAIKLHNPRAGAWYKERILSQIEILKGNMI